MDATPHLLTDVKFSERRKGYDPEEVDNFLAQVSEKVAQLQDMVREATARADEADAKVADAQRAKEVAQAQVDKLKADLARLEAAPRPLDEQEEAERASKILLMAQKTADATIEDANRSAQATIAEARQQAASMLADAEAEAEKLRAEAKRQIDELVQQRRGEILAEVGELERARDELSADVEALRNHLDVERQNNQRALDAIRQALDDPTGLRVAEPPPLHPVTLPERSSVEDAPAPAAEESASDAAAPEEGVAPGVAGAGDAPQEAVGEATIAAGPTRREPLGEAPAAEEAPSGPHPEPAAPDASTPVPESTAADAEPTAGGDADAGDLGTERLFETAEPGGSPLDPGPATELFTPFPEDAEREDPLGQPDAEADAAMRAFFEADFEAEAEQKRSRWRR